MMNYDNGLPLLKRANERIQVPPSGNLLSRFGYVHLIISFIC